MPPGVLGFPQSPVKGRLHLGQEADEGDGLGQAAVGEELPHGAHRDGGRPLQREAVHPGGNGGEGHSSFAAVSGLFILPTYPTLVAAVQMDDTGTTRIGKFVFNHPFFIPGTLGVALAVCFGFLLGSFML